MAMVISDVVADIKALITADPDSKYTGITKPDVASAEFDAFLWYVVKALVLEIVDQAELNSTSTGTPGVID